MMFILETIQTHFFTIIHCITLRTTKILLRNIASDTNFHGIKKPHMKEMSAAHKKGLILSGNHCPISFSSLTALLISLEVSQS
jgi:hypothetical protein